MGSCVSTPEEAARLRSEAIDKQLEEDHKKYLRECKILLLGSSGSGKTTIVKQMKIIHQNGFSREERNQFRPIVYQNIVDSAQAIVLYMRKMGLQCTQDSNRMLAERTLDYQLEVTGSKDLYFSPEIADAIHQFHKDPAVQKMINEPISDFHLMDNAPYFFEHVLRIGSPDYLPNVTDVLHTYRRTIGITEMRFEMGELSIRMFDIGAMSSERRKWIHHFEDMTSIIFCVALSEYDQVLSEDKRRNRMTDSLVLFESVINSRWFLHTSVILFLNKTDVFKRKLIKVPLERHFPEYTGGRDVNKAAKYILWRFMQVNRARLSVYPHMTQATDTTDLSFSRLVVSVVKETILCATIRHARSDRRGAVGAREITGRHAFPRKTRNV